MTVVDTKPQTNSVKVDTERIDAVLDMVGELVVLKSQLINETKEYQHNIKLSALVSLIEKSIRDLQDKSLGMRMTPLKGLFLKTQRVVRDLSVKLNKPVDFEMSGDDTEIDRNMVEVLGDPLMHIARNALDHGIEKPESRRDAGKPSKGTIRLVAQQLGSRIIVTISDDGAGISREKVYSKAVEKGLISADRKIETMGSQEIFQLLFEPGFSTAENVSEISGRGVGMDVVKSNIERLRGNIEIKTEEGKGTTFVITVPLTTSITEGMLVQVAHQLYILPLDGIRELVNLTDEALTTMPSGEQVVNVRDRLLPVMDLNLVLSRDQNSQALYQKKETDTIVVTEASSGLVALRVQKILGQVQVVLKSLSEFFPSTGGVAGAAILGDGKVALVLDVDEINKQEAVVA